ncbi:MAG TPA: hypothetical protein PKB02_16375 [Anaerohalosphaeraceae bacterium]|nr:hypothetical protein [Anaerohalosphaeraceae bacterium]
MKRDHVRIACKSICLMAMVALLIFASPALADVSYDSSINFYKDGAYDSIESDGTDDSHVSYQSFSGGV